MKNEKIIGIFFYQASLLIVGIIIILPLIYAVSISLMKPDEILTKEFRFFSRTLTYFENYSIVFQQTKVLRFMFNSFVVAFISCSLRIIISSLSAFSFAFFEYRGKNFLFALVISSLIIPAESLLIQNYFTTAELGLINSYLGMMVVFFISGINIFVMRQSFLKFSKEIYNAALIDGCSNLKFYYKILLPSNIPIITVVFISSFVGVWNTYLWPLLVTNVDEMRTAQVAVTMLNINEGNSYGPGAVMAASTVVLVPSIFIFLIFQRKIIGEFLSGAVKG